MSQTEIQTTQQPDRRAIPLNILAARASTQPSPPISQHQHTIPHPSPLSPQKKSHTEKKWQDYGIGLLALILALVFGVGAWVGMNMQYKQSAQSLELSIWTACADHEQIQSTELCRGVMGKSFGELGGRDGEGFWKRGADVSLDRGALVCGEGVYPVNFSEEAGAQNYHSLSVKSSFTPKSTSLVRSSAQLIFQLLLHSAIAGYEMAVVHGICLMLRDSMPEEILSVVTSPIATILLVSGIKSDWLGISYWGVVVWTVVARVGACVIKQMMVSLWRRVMLGWEGLLRKHIEGRD